MQHRRCVQSLPGEVPLGRTGEKTFAPTVDEGKCSSGCPHSDDPSGMPCEAHIKPNTVLKEHGLDRGAATFLGRKWLTLPYFYALVLLDQ